MPLWLIRAFSMSSRSIVRKTGWDEAKLAEVKRTAKVCLDHPAEFKLAKVLCRLPEVILRLSDELLFHKLCDYLYEVSCTFTEFYDNCYCIEQDNGKDTRPPSYPILIIDF